MTYPTLYATLAGGKDLYMAQQCTVEVEDTSFFGGVNGGRNRSIVSMDDQVMHLPHSFQGDALQALSGSGIEQS